jgi:hypothetical protein
MRFLLLRIAWSVVWGFACVVMIVLWVRSYFWYERWVFRYSHDYGLAYTSFVGTTFFIHYDRRPRDVFAWDSWFVVPRDGMAAVVQSTVLAIIGVALTGLASRIPAKRRHNS